MVRPHELQCCHGIGHQMGIHGCDGCCGLIFGGLVEQTEDRILELLEEHQMNGKTTSGFLGGCTCGEFVDDYRGHLIELISGENN
jgi:hypothetical protein